jgi:hypothetical protein
MSSPTNSQSTTVTRRSLLKLPLALAGAGVAALAPLAAEGGPTLAPDEALLLAGFRAAPDYGREGLLGLATLYRERASRVRS